MSFIESHGYTFYVEESPLYDVTSGEICIEFISLKKQPCPCVRIIVSKNQKETIAELQMLNYYASCNPNPMLENHEGTIQMIKTALAYMLTRYPHVAQVGIQDETFINIPTKPLITSRRLLLGQQGWYEEYLGAHPSAKIETTLEFLRQPKTQTQLHEILLKFPEAQDTLGGNQTWWSPKNLKRVADELDPVIFQRLLGTTWTLSAKTINSWNALCGGGVVKLPQIAFDDLIQKQSQRLKTIVRNARTGYVNGHQIQ